MSSTDKTGDQLVASIRRTRQGVAGKDAAKTVPVTAKPPAGAGGAAAGGAPVNTPKRPAAIARYPARPRVWPD